MFNYLYQEFLPTFQSNPKAQDLVMAAYCLANGEMPHLVISSAPTHTTSSQLKSAHAASPWAKRIRQSFVSVILKIVAAFDTGISRPSVRANASNSCVQCGLRPSHGARTVQTFRQA